MTTTPLQTVLCQYRYDALDRSITWTPDRQAGLQRFFCKDRLATEIHNAAQRSIFQHDDQVLAQQNRWGDKVDTTLLATDQQRSVLNAVDSIQAHCIAYTPYGHRSVESVLLSLLGFNGERPDLVTGHYHLGNGYRQFNPVLMRFNSPDKLSPFGKGGINAYAYCGNDPLNWIDPNGTLRFRFWKKNISYNKASEIAVSLMDDYQPRLLRKTGKNTYQTTGLEIIDKYNRSDKKIISREFYREHEKFLGRYETTINSIKELKLTSKKSIEDRISIIENFETRQNRFKDLSSDSYTSRSPGKQIEWLYEMGKNTKKNKTTADNFLEQHSEIRHA